MNEVQIAQKTKPKRRLGYGCCMFLTALFFVVIILGLAVVVLFFVRYETWERDNKDLIFEVAGREIEDRDEVKKELEKRLNSFNTSSIQREVIRLDCDMMNVLVEEIAAEHWYLRDHSDVGVVCGERSLTLYVKVWNMWWLVTRVWQRADGEVDFVVHDLTVGPFSLSGITFGSVSSNMTDGIKDAVLLTSGEDYSGRRIEEIYLEKDGIRVVGVRD